MEGVVTSDRMCMIVELALIVVLVLAWAYIPA
jgi:hypothetical protein